MKETTCSSCKKKVANMVGTVKFVCPNCGKTDIIRCGHCREIVAKYKCHECGFEGPN
ncbi:zinc finger domain-containing protein [Nanoarchaeota archaeon]